MAQFTATGAYTALVTPFSTDGNTIDWNGFERLVELQIAGGITGLVPCGTTGEAPTLNWNEHHEVIQRTIQIARGRTQIVAGVGSNNTRESVEAARKVLQAGADAAMVVVPYYNRPNQEGIFQHVRAIAESADGPLVLYNIPARTGRAVTVDTICRIAEACPNVVALKDASNNVHDCQALRCRLGDRLRVLSGDDALTVPLMSVGASGVISVTSNAYPRAIQDVVDSMLAGNWVAAQREHFALLPVHEAMFCAPNPTPIKSALAAKGIIGESVRLPMVPLTQEERERLLSAMKEYEAR